MRRWTPEEAMKDALAKHPNCSYADWANGLKMAMSSKGPALRLTIVVQLWRNEECWMSDDPPRHIEEGYAR